MQQSKWRTYDFPIQIVLLHHNNVDTLGVLEGQKPEAARTTSRAVSHDSALADLAELREIIFQGFYDNV
jgi:hypothetical protein